MIQYVIAAIKGVAMGAANVIPGVSGGTIALITGIFERLIDAMKSINLKSLKLLFTGKIVAFVKAVDLYFIISVFFGVIISIFSLARLLEYLFTNHHILVWSYFFGLIVASVYYVGKTITSWKIGTILMFIVGFGIMLAFTRLSPAQEHNTVWYNFIAGIVAASAMILPGLSGSFVLLLMGNYHLVMIESVNNLDMSVLVPVAVGAVVGILAFSHFLSWVFKKYKDQTIALLTGLILGSLSIIWPWKIAGETYIDRHGEVQAAVTSTVLPNTYETVTTSDAHLEGAIICLIAGILTIVIVEWQVVSKSKIEKTL